jgi:hypothetical protein
LGVEDSRTIDRGNLANTATMFTGTATANPAAQFALGSWGNSYGGNGAPDIAGNIRVDQAAFTLQVSGALHQNRANYYGATEVTGHPDDKFGGAASVGLQLKNLPTGPGDKLSLDGTWSKGAIKYVIGGVMGTASGNLMGFSNFGGPAFAGSYQSFAAVTGADAVYGPGSSLELTTAWGFRGAYVHNWSPNWETSVFGSYTKVDFNTNATALVCGAQLLQGAKSNGYSCNPDFAIWQVGTRTAWTPVQNLTFSAEVLYTTLDQAYTGSTTFTATPTGTSKPAGATVYDYKDQGMWSGNIRVRRTF